MNAAYDKLCEHLTNQNVGFWSRSEDLSICTDFRGEVGTYRIFARVDADDSLFQVFGHSPVRVPPGSRPAIAEAVARINCGLKVGKFEMDCDEGELRFQAAQILPDDDLDDADDSAADWYDHVDVEHLPPGRPVGHLRQRTAEGCRQARRARAVCVRRKRAR